MQERNPRRWWILVVLVLSTLVLVIDNMVLTVAVPPLSADLGASPQDIQWILDSYILVFAGLLLTSGSLGDRFGRRKIMIIGLAAFGASSLLAAFATDPTQLIIARTVMGIGGALIMPSTLSILITVFDDKERPKAMAVWSAAATVGFVGGPVLGGALIAWFWWGAVFLINVPIAVLAIIAAVALMPESKGPWQKPDPLGAVLSALGMTAVVWTIIELPKYPFSDPNVLVPLGIAVVSLIAFVVWEKRTPSPMVPLNLFKARNFSGGSLALTLSQIGNGGLMIVVTQYLQFVLGFTPTEAGLAFLPMAVGSLVCNGLGATLGQKIGNRLMAAIGLSLYAVAFFWMSTLSSDAGFLPIGAALLVLGCGGGLAVPAAIAALMGTVPPEQAGVGSALNDTIQQLGAALGVAALGSILSGVFTAEMPAGSPVSIGESIQVPGLAETARTAFTDAMSTTFVISGIGVLVAAAIALIVMRDNKTDSPVEEPALV
ncbi:MFS transporter [Kibdelosporangium aridum]|uniref:MFS transporter n=1 Tax=Kibdelosporangium aridum TaxID=2030 RepID=A0A428Z7U9_KIBAR|nr:MFS transporter [Kibdelosporangium aridum]RSM83875.1 MFS transporter [Kibdelosporangium aridum]